MEKYTSPQDEEHLRKGNSDAALEGHYRVPFEQTGYYTKAELDAARAAGKTVLITGWGVAILDVEQPAADA